MKLKVLIGYNDKELDRYVSLGEIIEVTEERANVLEKVKDYLGRNIVERITEEDESKELDGQDQEDINPEEAIKKQDKQEINSQEEENQDPEKDNQESENMDSKNPEKENKNPKNIDQKNGKIEAKNEEGYLKKCYAQVGKRCNGDNVEKTP